MCSALLRLPLTSTLLAVLLLGSDGLLVTPQVVVAVAVAFVVINVLPDPTPRTSRRLPAGGDRAPGEGSADARSSTTQ
jgi:hypothetical protein